MDLELKGKTIFVTGASSGIGRATAELFAAEGATVVIGYHTKGEEAEQLRLAILARGGAALTAQIDLGDLESIRRCLAAVVARAGTFDSVVFNAGALKLTPLEDISVQEWDHMLAVNLKGPFFLLQAIAPHIRAGGSAVFVASIAGQTGAPAHAHYAAAKAGLINLAKSAAKRYASAIRINCVAPGVTLTAMGEEALQGADLDAARGKLLARRFAEPAEVAKVVVFLASPAASFIYGATIDVNGGRELR